MSIVGKTITIYGGAKYLVLDKVLSTTLDMNGTHFPTNTYLCKKNNFNEICFVSPSEIISIDNEQTS